MNTSPIDVNRELGYDPDLVAQEIMQTEPGAPIPVTNAFDPVWRDDCAILKKLKDQRAAMQMRFHEKRWRGNSVLIRQLAELERQIDAERKRLGLV